jgi:hypothetical protein
MEMPTVQATIKDPTAGVTYRVLAYRRVTRNEVLRAIAAYTAQKKRKPKKGSVVDIVTTYGFNDSPRL